MRIAAVHSPQGKIFGVVEGDTFRSFSVGGASLRDLRHVIKLVSEGTPPEYGAPTALGRAKLAAPVGPLSKNVICVGKNYYDHAREFAQSGVDQSGDKQEDERCEPDVTNDDRVPACRELDDLELARPVRQDAPVEIGQEHFRGGELMPRRVAQHGAREHGGLRASDARAREDREYAKRLETSTSSHRSSSLSHNQEC